MHISSLENLRRLLKCHLTPDPRFTSSRFSVLEVGSADVNGSYRNIFAPLDCSYHGVDLAPGIGVDTVLDDPYSLPFADDTFDVVLSGQTFEHAELFWQLFDEIGRVVRPDGIIFILVPSGGDIHRYPVDCYRFHADAMSALAKSAGMHLVDSWTSGFGPWYDTVGVFKKPPTRSADAVWSPDLSLRLAQPVQNEFPPNVPEEVEKGAGTEDCYDFLIRAHRFLRPSFYAEIGVEYGRSLRLADCPALGIDPAPQLTEPIGDRHELCLTTSDDFFWLTDHPKRTPPIDLCYVDGMHQIEYAMRDFMYVERLCHKGSVIVVDDIYPAHELQGARIRQSRFWTGDVWKMIPILQNVRPELILLPLDTSPTGSLLVLGTDPENSELWDRYDVLMDWSINFITEVPTSIVDRTESFDPRDPLIGLIFGILRNARGSDEIDDAIARVRQLVAESRPRRVVDR